MKELNVGDTAVLERAFSQEQVAQFATLSTDNNPIHIDAGYASTTSFGRPIVHGMLVGSLFSALVGQHLPGEGSIYMGQNLRFHAPVLIGQVVKAKVEITAIREDKPIVTLETTCTSTDGENIITGDAVVYVPWLMSS